MPRTGRGRATRSTRSPATFALHSHLIETYNHIDDLPHLSSLPKKRPRHATRGATAAERRADRQAAAVPAAVPDPPLPNAMVTRSSRQNLLRPSNSASPLTVSSPSSQAPDHDDTPITCRVCLKSNTSRKLVCCSICRKGIHTFCLNPPVMDLPNDSSWKCIKCRRAHVPLKKEARIILRDALNTYSTLCTDKYINAVANVVCVVSDSESAHHKKNGKPSIKPTPHLDPSHARGTDNTVILRVSTDDSDLDSDVDHDIQPNHIVNPDKPPSRRTPERRDSNRDRLQDTNLPSPPQAPVPSTKKPIKEEHLLSSPSSLDIDDERPLSELMSRDAQRRHRYSRAVKTKDIGAVHVSPKMRLKAKQRRMREASLDEPSPPAADPSSARDPRNLPIKRRGAKPISRRTDKHAPDNGKPMDGDGEKDGAGQNGDGTRQVGKGDHNAEVNTPAPMGEPNRKEAKRESKEEKVGDSGAPGSSGEDRRGNDASANLSDASGSNVDEGYPGDTEDDLPLSKRSARYRKLPAPGSSKERKEKNTPQHDDERESGESPCGARNPVFNDPNRSHIPKSEAIAQETTGNINGQPAESSVRVMSGGDDVNPSTSHPSLVTNPITERKPSEKWAKIKLDPKREALFALARVQRQRPKPGDSSGRLSTSFDGEGSGRFSKLMSRTENVPESERQRIQVTALAASNMRRNVSNMASTMAGLRPHSPRISKGSLDLLLQQNQPEVRSSITAQRSHTELPMQKDVSIPGHDNRRERTIAPPNSSHLHLPEADSAKLPTGLFQQSRNPGRNPGRQEDTRNSSFRQYANPTTMSGTETYPLPQQSNVSRRGPLSSMEPEAQPFAHYNRDADLLPHTKRHRSNKSDLSNMLSNESGISLDESHLMQRGNPSPNVLSSRERPVLQQSTVRGNAVQRHHSNGPAHDGRAIAPYAFPHRLPESRFEAPRAPAGALISRTVGRDTLSLPQSSLSTIGERSTHTRHPSSGLEYSSFPFGHSGGPQAGSSTQRPRNEDDNRLDQQPHVSSSTHRGYGSDFRTPSQVYSSSNPAGESLPTGLRWTEGRNLGANALGSGYSGGGAASQHWSGARSDHRPAPQNHPYDAPSANTFLPTERRPRRLMPYVPTATRKAQFEQGRALAFIDSSPVPPSADPSENFRVDDGLSRMTPRSYSAHQEGPFSHSNDFSYSSGGRSRAGYPNVDNQAPANAFRGDYYAQRRDYSDSRNERRLDDRSRFVLDASGETARRERVGTELTTNDGLVFGLPRPVVHGGIHNSSGAPIEPPIDSQKGPTLERTEAPPLGPLVDARVRSHSEKDIPRTMNTLEPDRRLPEKRGRLSAGLGQDERVYATNSTGNSTRRRTELVDPVYGSYLSRRNHNETIHPPVGTIMDARIPVPLHADPGQYRSRTTLGGPSGHNFVATVGGASGSRASFDRGTNQISSAYGYASNADPRHSIVSQRVRSFGGNKEDFGADRVSNIPLVARFDNSLTAYVEGNAVARSSDRDDRVGERSGGQRSEQRERLPSLRSNPSLRDLLS